MKYLAAFVREPNRETFTEAANTMRKDLWNGKAVISEDVLSALDMFPQLLPPVRPASPGRQMISEGVKV